MPDGVAYDRFVVHHHMILNEQAAKIAALETRLAALEAQGTRPGRRG
jgi:BMFP domain-containing protein YqiC